VELESHQWPLPPWANPVSPTFRLMTPTFLLTDIEGSTRLWETHRQARGEALACHDRLVLQVVADHEGRLVKAKGEGDSSFSVFTSPAEAVAAALELQRALPPSPGRCRHRWRCGRRCMPGGSGARGRLLRAGGQPVRSAARHRPRLPIAPGRLHPTRVTSKLASHTPSCTSPAVVVVNRRVSTWRPRGRQAPAHRWSPSPCAHPGRRSVRPASPRCLLAAPREHRRRPDGQHIFIRRGWPATAMGGLSAIPA
jgi:class 3 adenylate cyclase